MYSCSFWVLKESGRVISEFGGLFHGSRLRSYRLFIAPNANEDGLDFVFEMGDQVTVCTD